MRWNRGSNNAKEHADQNDKIKSDYEDLGISGMFHLFGISKQCHVPIPSGGFGPKAEVVNQLKTVKVFLGKVANLKVRLLSISFIIRL